MKPLHPGEMLREEFLIPANITAEKLAEDISVSLEKIQALIEEKTDLDANISLRLSLYFKMNSQF